MTTTEPTTTAPPQGVPLFTLRAAIPEWTDWDAVLKDLEFMDAHLEFDANENAVVEADVRATSLTAASKYLTERLELLRPSEEKATGLSGRLKNRRRGR